MQRRRERMNRKKEMIFTIALSVCLSFVSTFVVQAKGISLEDLRQRYGYAIFIMALAGTEELEGLQIEDMEKSIEEETTFSPNDNGMMALYVDENDSNHVNKIILYDDKEDEIDTLFLIEVIATYFAFNTSLDEEIENISLATQACSILTEEGKLEYKNVEMTYSDTGEYLTYSFEYMDEDSDQNQTMEVTLGEKNALEKAYSYLEISAFSYEDLVDQLLYAGFTESEAIYAADNCGANWKEQAAAKAESYLEITSFSRQGLADQLEYNGFSEEEIEYALKAVGY